MIPAFVINPCLSGAALVLLALPLPGLAQDLTAARKTELTAFLHQDCGSCHGMTLQGGLGPPLLPAALNGKTDGLLIETILSGRPGTAMPPWQDLLSRDEVVWLVQRLRSGPETPATPPAK